MLLKLYVKWINFCLKLTIKKVSSLGARADTSENFIGKSYNTCETTESTQYGSSWRHVLQTLCIFTSLTFATEMFNNSILLPVNACCEKALCRFLLMYPDFNYCLTLPNSETL